MWVDFRPGRHVLCHLLLGCHALVVIEYEDALYGRLSRLLALGLLLFFLLAAALRDMILLNSSLSCISGLDRDQALRICL